MSWPRAVTLVNARVAASGGEARSLRFGAKILDLDATPHPHDTVIDVEGAVVLPGLVNAHDHLELNHYGRIKFRERHTNVAEWIDDMRPNLKTDPRIVAGAAETLSNRLFIGALKNLLAGVTTVAHHNPFYRELRFGCPIHVVRRYGWAHSFLLERAPAGARGEPGGDIATRWRATPANAPFIVHLAEGTDDAAEAELDRLDHLGCLQSNVVMVHGVAIEPDGWAHAASRGAGLVWCPASNAFLFDRTAPVRQFLDRTAGGANGHIALGTDSRLSGARDLLDELRIAAASAAVSPDELLGMVTGVAADLLKRPQAGRIAVGAPADFLVIPDTGGTPAESLLRAERRDVQLVVVEGRPLVAAPALGAVFEARGNKSHAIEVDDVARQADRGLARRIAECPIAEPGVYVLQGERSRCSIFPSSRMSSR